VDNSTAVNRKTAALPAIGKAAVVTITGLLLVFALLEAAIVVPAALSRIDVTWGYDLRMYVAHAERWLADGTFYQAHQLAGPYIVEATEPAVYPPVILYLLVPLVAGVPWALWWIVPLAILGAAVARSRPSPWQWVALATILVYPRTWTIIVFGNPAMWALAFLAAGMVWKWPAVFVFLKTTYAPFALVGIRSRHWWLALGGGLVLALPFGTMWLDFPVAVLNAQTSRGIEYTLGEWPIAIALVVSLAGGGARWPRGRSLHRTVPDPAHSPSSP
jgi:hypothetical protein